MKRALRVAVFIIVLGCFALPAGAYKIGRYITDDYHDACEAPNLDDMTTTWDWKTELLSHAGWTSSNAYNHDLTWNRLDDPDLVAGGQDYWYIEGTDIVMWTGHGGRGSQQEQPRRWYYKRADEYNGDNCATSPRTQMMLGETLLPDISILHILSCQSMEWDDSVYWNTWGPVAKGIHQINGYHGLAYGSADELRDDYYRLARDGYSSGAVSNEWIIEMYEEDIEPGIDNCPASFAGGNTSQRPYYLLTHETYSNLAYTDILNPTEWSYNHASPCDPDEGSAF